MPRLFGRVRCGFKRFLVTLAAVYFAAMYLLNSGLGGPPGGHGDDAAPAPRWDQVGADADSAARRPREVDNSDVQAPVAAVHHMLGDNGLQQAFDNFRAAEQGNPAGAAAPRQAADDAPSERRERLPAVAVEPSEPELNVPGSCESATDLPPNFDEFRELLGGDVILLSAFWDERPNDFDNRHNGTLIRLMAVVRGGARPELACDFPAWSEADEGQVSPLRYYEMCENHGRMYGSFILSCHVPDHVIEPPCSVTVRTKRGDGSAAVRLRTLRPRPEPPASRFSVCVPPLFGAVADNRLIEFFELTFLLGADHVIIYHYDVPDATLSLLAHLSARCRERGTCRITTIPWRLPKDVDSGIWYHGQSVAIQDCLYRHMASSQHVLFGDIDEFVVPDQKLADWSSMVAHLDSPRRCALQFVSAFFNPLPLDESDRTGVDLLTMRSLKRSDFSSIRTKCMVRPYEIFEAGIHHISKPIWADLEVHRVDANVALLHHYRGCHGNADMNCMAGATDDRSILRYHDRLKAAVLDTVRSLTVAARDQL